MDAKQLGTFIAARRKELGFTQALLAEQLHVTDKAISRWERGVGLPDLSNMEPLAAALDISLIELMQARRNDDDHMSTKEAEKLLIDTIKLSQAPNIVAKWIGCIVLAVFAIIACLVLLVLLADWKVASFSAWSIITGLMAWGIPIWRLTMMQTTRAIYSAITSFGFALLSLMIQFMNIANELHTHDLAAVEDTIDALVLVVLLFISVTLILNILMVRKHK